MPPRWFVERGRFAVVRVLRVSRRRRRRAPRGAAVARVEPPFGDDGGGYRGRSRSIARKIASNAVEARLASPLIGAPLDGPRRLVSRTVAIRAFVHGPGGLVEQREQVHRLPRGRDHAAVEFADVAQLGHDRDEPRVTISRPRRSSGAGGRSSASHPSAACAGSRRRRSPACATRRHRRARSIGPADRRIAVIGKTLSTRSGVSPYNEGHHADQTPGRHPQLGNHRQEALSQSARVPRRDGRDDGGGGRRACWAPSAFCDAATPAPHGRKLENVKKSPFSADEKPNKWEEITTYNNYYEFGTDKDSPAMLARNLKTEPWTVAIDGECARRATCTLEDILKGQALEERIYRHRCVEAWSMVIPWVGFPLADSDQEVRADVEGEVRRVHDALRSEADARPALAGAALAVRRRAPAWTRRCTR